MHVHTVPESKKVAFTYTEKALIYRGFFGVDNSLDYYMT